MTWKIPNPSVGPSSSYTCRPKKVTALTKTQIFCIQQEEKPFGDFRSTEVFNLSFVADHLLFSPIEGNTTWRCHGSGMDDVTEKER